VVFALHRYLSSPERRSAFKKSVNSNTCGALPKKIALVARKELEVTFGEGVNVDALAVNP
jgi:hypothetical protein